MLQDVWTVVQSQSGVGCYWDKKAMDLTPCLGELGHKKKIAKGGLLDFMFVGIP